MIDGDVAYGTLIPREMVDQFGPDKDKGSFLYWIDGDSEALKALADKPEKNRLAVYVPHVFRKGLSVHLVVLRRWLEDKEVPA